MGKFVISKGFSGGYYFSLKAPNGQIILASQNYVMKESCLRGIESVKHNATNIERFEKMVAKNGTYYFNLKAGNGEIIGKSELYITMAARDNGIEAVKNNAPTATIQDLS
jgi:uncharacterized protein YegP (UPF0339 family)